MRIIYVLLSPTPGMHQYTGDLAAQMVRAGHDVHVVTTSQAPRACYPAQVGLHTPVHQRSTGFTPEGLRGRGLRHAYASIVALQPDLVHFGGVHLWNPLLMLALRRSGFPVVHTLHDLDPHPGVRNGALIRQWNRTVIKWSDGIVVHGMRYRDRLLTMGRQPSTVLATPLLHSFLTAEEHEGIEEHMPPARFAPWSLFFGRFERYKGLDVLLNAQRILTGMSLKHGLVVAGGGSLGEVWPHSLPSGVTLLNRRIQSQEGSELFQNCSVLVLPYTGATQSALPATAYAFGKPVIVADSGAMAEVVQPGVTGWVVPAGDPEALAGCLAAVHDKPELLAAAGCAGRRWYDAQRSRQQADLTRFYAAAVAGSDIGGLGE